MGALAVTVAAVVLAFLTVPSAADGNESPGAPAPARSLTIGGAQTCTIVTGGGVRCWGSATYGQLGIGSFEARGGRPRDMGGNLPAVDLGTGRSAVALAAGDTHTCALLDDATVKCWGLNELGQLGQGNTANRGALPHQMGDFLPAIDLGSGRTATAITAGDSHTCALLDTGQVKCWGGNGGGRLGLGSTTARGDGASEMGDDLPTVDLGTGRTATAVTAGDSHTCALLDTGQVKCWGDGSFGRLGLGASTSIGDHANEMGDTLPAVDLGTGRTATAITAANRHTCALLDTGQVKCWGYNLYGQLGLGSTTNLGDSANEMGDDLPTVDLGTGRTATAVTAGRDHTCALLDDGTVKCWGLNSAGQLGQGSTTNLGDGAGEMGDDLPAVDLGTGRTATAVTTGGSLSGTGSGSTCALLDDGSLKCWGANNGGQLGLGDTEYRGDDPGELGDALPAVVATGSGITGQVIDSVVTVGASTVPGALVAAMRTSDFSIAAGGVADTTGRFTFETPPGQYFVYAIDRTGNHLPGFVGAPTVFTVPDDIVPVTVIAPLDPTTGSVSGTITDAGTGAPIAGAAVLVVEATSGAPVRVVPAGADGSYHADGIRAGSYKVAFVDLGGGHTPRYFGGTSTPIGATRVDVVSGASTPVDQALPSQPSAGDAATLSGRVSEEGTNARLSGTLVVALRASDLTFVRAGFSNGTGGFALTVPPGEYKLLFLDGAGSRAAQWWRDQPVTGLAAATSVTAPGHADPYLARTTGMISGTVSAGGTGVSSAWVVAIRPTGVAGAAVTNPTGGYLLSGLPVDTYRAAVIDPAKGVFAYWPHATTYADAADFVVFSGGDTPIDASLG